MRLAAFVLPTLLSFSLNLQAHTPAKVNFYSGTFHELRKEAFEEDLPYVLYFSYPGEASSREMETFTFQEPNLSRYISQNYLIFKISAGNGNRGNDFLEKEFNVHEPSMIIFDAKSYELKRIRGFVDPDILLNSLRKYQPERGSYVGDYTSNKVGITPSIDQAPKRPIIEDLGPNTSVRRIANEFFVSEDSPSNTEIEQNDESQLPHSDELIIIDQNDTDPPKSHGTQATNSVWKRTDPLKERQGTIEDREILSKRFDFEEENSSADYTRPYTRIPLPAEKYEERITELQTQEKDWISAKEQITKEPKTYPEEPYNAVQHPTQKRGFGIQTGVFGESYFMRKEVDFLQSRFNQDVFVKKARFQGKEVFKVQVGPFKSEDAARAFEKVFRRVSGNRKGMLVYIQ